MGILDWFSSKEETKEVNRDELVRYLCRLEKKYDDMDDFMEDFFDLLNDTIDRYNESNPLKAEKLDRDKAYKVGGNWAYEANVERISGQEEKKETAKNFYKRKSTFKVIARKQPHFAIEVSGTESLVSPFLEALESVLSGKGFDHEIAAIAKPNLGKAKRSESEG